MESKDRIVYDTHTGIAIPMNKLTALLKEFSRVVRKTTYTLQNFKELPQIKTPPLSCVPTKEVRAKLRKRRRKSNRR